MKQVRTTDLGFAAYAACLGHLPDSIESIYGNSAGAIMTFDRLPEDVSTTFYSGAALVNPIHFHQSLRLIRQRIDLALGRHRKPDAREGR